MKGMSFLYSFNNPYQPPYSNNTRSNNSNNTYNSPYNNFQYPYDPSMAVYNPNLLPYQYTNAVQSTDYGPAPFAVNIEEATKQNNAFRTALWTGNHLQLTLMSINPGEDIGLETHPNLDQFIRIEDGQGIVLMGDRSDRLDFRAYVRDDFAFIIPAGKWHNLINTGNTPLKLYSIYAPPQHPHGTVHATKADAQAAERHGH